jgi:hypothetical protein
MIRKRQQIEAAGAKIDFEHLGIGTVLSRYSLLVPPNQREYKWTDDQVLDLLHDFSNALKRNTSSYFLGTIVLTGGGSGLWEVADGQQRLATTTILLAAIRDFLHERNEQMLVQWIETKFLFEIIPDEREIAPRLTLNLADNDYFKKRVLSNPESADRHADPKKPSNRRIDAAARLAAEHLKKSVSDLGESDVVPHLTQWARFIENAVQVIVLEVPDDLNAYVMFETLNDRGLEVSQADLVKNYLFGEAGDRSEEAQHKWATMVGVLETLESQDEITLSYLRHLLSSMYGLQTGSEVFSAIKRKVKGRGGAVDFIGILADRANDYVAILNPEHPKWNTYNPSIRSSIRTLNELRAVPLRHIMLATARYFNTRETEKTFRLLISWAVRFLVTGGGRGGRLEEAYAERAKEISEGKITTTKRLADAMADTIPSDLEFESQFAIATEKKSKLARYYLRALELKVKGNPEPEFVPNDEPVINLEHVLPENPGAGWHIDRETAKAYYSRLGNMVLLQASKNANIGNRKFADKQPVLRDSAYLLTAEVGRNDNWGVDEINERQARLARLAVKTWPIDVK